LFAGAIVGVIYLELFVVMNVSPYPSILCQSSSRDFSFALHTHTYTQRTNISTLADRVWFLFTLTGDAISMTSHPQTTLSLTHLLHTHMHNPFLATNLVPRLSFHLHIQSQNTHMSPPFAHSSYRRSRSCTTYCKRRNHRSADCKRPHWKT
jgi:hypothetical protein